MEDDLKEALSGVVVSMVPVGSRVTCNPAPADTDEDYLVLVDSAKWRAFSDMVDLMGFERGGSEIPDEANIVAAEDRFRAYRLDEINLIVTHSEFFHNRFLAATHVAKQLNLLGKEERVMLFQAVLYGNIREQMPFIAALAQEEEILF